MYRHREIDHNALFTISSIKNFGGHAPQNFFCVDWHIQRGFQKYNISYYNLKNLGGDSSPNFGKFQLWRGITHQPLNISKFHNQSRTPREVPFQKIYNMPEKNDLKNK